MLEELEGHDPGLVDLARRAGGDPPAGRVTQSRQAVSTWFAGIAPLVGWDALDSPLGTIYVAATQRGVCSVAFGITSEDFLAQIDPLARTERRPDVLADALSQLRRYFETPFSRFDLPLDLSAVTPFQQAALQTAQRIPAGTVWTYRQLAEAVGRPRASRAVGQAMAHNPVPILIPCHRVVGSSGALTGYGGGGGLATKRWLLQREGAL
jgi:O-6-methylguanine DNA methyltransferase